MKQETRLNITRELKLNQAALYIINTVHTWQDICHEADLNAESTIIQLRTGSISDDKVSAINSVLEKRLSNEGIQRITYDYVTKCNSN